MSLSKDLRRKLGESRALVESALENLPLIRSGSAQSQECAYSLGAGGKRLRPFLVFESCAALSGDTSLAVPAACAVEMIHTYSLIHDDLPGMDDDDIRRGKPSLHIVYGIDRALFAGDRLLLEAFLEILRSPLPVDSVRLMAEKLAGASGPSYLVGGQFMDMYHPAEADSRWTRRMILGKTSAMIRVSMELGVIAAGIGFEELASVSAIGDDIGWLFQLTDDILDVTGSSSEMGKAVAKDAEMGKWNPVGELGISRAQSLARETSSMISSRLTALQGDWNSVIELVEYLPERRK